LGTAVQAYQHRMGIEAFFRDYKSGGYQVESTHLHPQRLSGLFVLLALPIPVRLSKAMKFALKAYPAIFVEPKKDEEGRADIAIFG